MSPSLAVSIDVLKLAGAITLGVQGLKKFPFIEVLLAKAGWWAPVALTLAAGIAGGIYQYGADGSISVHEAGLIVASIVGAIGIHSGTNMVEGKLGK